MRSLGLALLILAFSASGADAAVIEFDDRSSPEDNEPTIAIVVRAAPGETNAITVTRSAGGIMIEDIGAPLTGECQPSGSGRFCAGANFGVVDVFLGDGNDSLDHGFFGAVEGGAGDDDIRVTNGIFSLVGGAGADRLDATAATEASVSYFDHTDGVSVRVNGLADDGVPGEGDNVMGAITSIGGGHGNDYLESGPVTGSLFGADGNDILVGNADRNYLTGGPGDDQLLAGDGSDSLVGDAGADILSGGGGLDEVTYGGVVPLRLSIGNGPNDGAAGEGDDIRDDVEAIGGGQGDDVLIGDSDGNRLIGYGGRDVLRGGDGADEVIGWGEGDELDGGAGPDRVSTRPRRLGGIDRALLVDGEADRLDCGGAAPFIDADAGDRLTACAPTPVVHARGRMRRGRRVTLFVRCARDAAVPCLGRLWIHLQGTRRDPQSGRRLSRVIRFGPIEAGERRRLRVLIRGRVPRKGYVYASAITRRNDGLATRTVTRNVIRYLPG
jgi:RTX calcium-binding nonapeptide repeat (4 copies)